MGQDENMLSGASEIMTNLWCVLHTLLDVERTKAFKVTLRLYLKASPWDDSKNEAKGEFGVRGSHVM